MKILIVRTTPGKVDFFNVSYNRQETGLAKAFNRKGHQCDVVYFGGREEKELKLEYEPGKTFTVYLLKGIEVMKNGVYKNFDSLISQYDIIQCGGYDQIQSWRLAKKYAHKMTIYNGTYYSDFNKGYNKKCKIIDKLFVPRYVKNDVTFVTKNVLSAEFLKQKGIKTAIPIGVGIDTDQLAVFKEYDSDFSKRIEEEKKDSRLLLYIGRMEPRRNIPFMLKVFAEVKKQRSDVKLVMVSKGEAEYVNKCFDYAKELGVYDDIIWTEKLEQKYLTKIYKSCDIFLLPTLYEIFGMVLLEAMYFKLSVVTSLNGGSDILIKGRGNGSIVEEFDEKKWSEEVVRLLDNSEERELIGERAHKFIAEEFTWEALTEKFLDVYDNLLNNK